MFVLVQLIIFDARTVNTSFDTPYHEVNWNIAYDFLQILLFLLFFLNQDPLTNAFRKTERESLDVLITGKLRSSVTENPFPPFPYWKGGTPI